MVPARARPGAGQHDEIRHRRAARPGAPGDGPADRRKDWFSEPTSSGDARARGLDRPRPLRRTARRRPARGGSPARGKAAFHNSRAPVCQSGLSLCTDPYDNPSGTYVGHDEPSVEFKSDVPGSGNDITYTITLPTEPPKLPRNNGPDGATWNFQLRPTFWFGLTLCDTESAPEFTKACAPDSDANDLVGLDPAAPDYIGKHPGNAFMELQFYGPGYVPQFEGFGCDAHALLRGDDDRQPHARPEHEDPEQPRLRQLHPRRDRADQLGLHHAGAAIRRRRRTRSSPGRSTTRTSPRSTPTCRRTS